MHLKLCAKVNLSSLLLNRRPLTLEQSVSLLKSYAKCWMNTYIHIYALFSKENVPNFYQSLKRFNSIILKASL